MRAHLRRRKALQLAWARSEFGSGRLVSWRRTSDIIGSVRGLQRHLKRQALLDEMARWTVVGPDAFEELVQRARGPVTGPLRTGEIGVIDGGFRFITTPTVQ